MKHLLLLLATCLLLGCSTDRHRPFLLSGAWRLQQVKTPDGHIYSYDVNDHTLLRLYDADGTLRECRLTQADQALVVQPQARYGVRLIDKGGGQWLYLEDEDPRPLTVVDDSTITIQRNGRIGTWRRADDIAREWGDDIRSISDHDLATATATDEAPRSYVLSARERRQASLIQCLVCAIIAIGLLVLAVVQVALANRRAKRRLQLQLQQIEEEHAQRPQTVKQAIESVESAYFASEEYSTLQHHITRGQSLKDDDWQLVESHIRRVYPGFSSQLRGLYAMSELEYQVCLLIKLRIAPTDIAAVLARDASTISTVRSRLYKKVFGQKGGAREWDEFILSIGA